MVVRDAVKHTLTSFVFGYAEQENMLQNFSFGSKTGIEFINNPKHGGINGTLIAHGVDHSATSMIVNDVGNDAQFVNFQIVSMDVEARRRYLDIRDTVKGPRNSTVCWAGGMIPVRKPESRWKAVTSIFCYRASRASAWTMVLSRRVAR